MGIILWLLGMQIGWAELTASVPVVREELSAVVMVHHRERTTVTVEEPCRYGWYEKVNFTTTIWFYGKNGALRDYRFNYDTMYDPHPIPHSEKMLLSFYDTHDGCWRLITVDHHLITFTDQDPDPKRQGQGVFNGRPGLRQPYEPNLVARAIMMAR